MTTSIERDIRETTRPARPVQVAQKRSASADEVERRFTRDNHKPVTRGRASPIRAWRAPETDASQAPGLDARVPAKAASAFRQPFAPDASAGARPGARERAARMRAIEQAWKEERVRQAKLDAEEQRPA